VLQQLGDLGDDEHPAGEATLAFDLNHGIPAG